MNVRSLVPAATRPVVRAGFRRFGERTHRWRIEPAFIVIGGQRCGTTTIFKTLAGHPQIVRPTVDKGTDYYTLHYTKGRDWYRGHFPIRSVAQRRTSNYGAPVAFEACTYYMFHPYAIERLAQDFPGMKLVAMLRDPVERAYSAYKHELARGFETEPDFLRALQLEDQRLAGEEERLTDPAQQSFAHRHHAYRRRGEFDAQLSRVFDHFPRDQVHVMYSEAFFAEPAKEFRALLEFLEVASWEPAGFEQHNARPSSSMPQDAREFLTAHYAAHDNALGDLLGEAPFWTQRRGG